MIEITNISQYFLGLYEKDEDEMLEFISTKNVQKYNYTKLWAIAKTILNSMYKFRIIKKRMQVKFCDQFFPTKIRPATGNPDLKKNVPDQVGHSSNSKSYRLLKNRFIDLDLTSQQTRTQNIFAATVIPDYSFDVRKDKPVGGIELFLKEQNRKNSTQKSLYRPLSENRKGLQDREDRTIPFYETKKNIEPCQIEENPPIEEQILKSHQSYTPPTPIRPRTNNPSAKNNKHHKQPSIVSSKPLKNCSSAVVSPSPSGLLAASSRPGRQNNWVEKQTENYHNKMSVLNEIYYKKPLVEKYGDRYFEYLLRNRYEEDLPPPVYIHQIKSQEQAHSANTDRFISKILKMQPLVRKFEKLVLRGRNFVGIGSGACEDN